MSVCLCECVFVIKIRLQKISSSANPTADRVSERSSWCQESFIGIIKKACSVQFRARTRNESFPARTVEHNEASVLLTQSVIPKRDLFFFFFGILPTPSEEGGASRQTLAKELCQKLLIFEKFLCSLCFDRSNTTTLSPPE